MSVQINLLKTILAGLTSYLLRRIGNVLQFPIIVTTQNSDKLGQTIPSIADRLPTGTLCHDKSLFSMLEEEVVRDINQINPDRIVLVGIEAQICISQTALGKYTLFDVSVHSHSSR